MRKITGTLSMEDLPFLRDYEDLKPRLSIRLNNPNRIKPDTVSAPFHDLLVTCHIDVSDVVGADSASCTVKNWMLDDLRAEKERLFSDAIENSVKNRPAVTMPIEEYMMRMGYPNMKAESHLVIATVEGLTYGASVVMYPCFLESISGGKNLFLIPSSIHEWLYLEDMGEHGKEELTELLRAVNREVVAEEEILSDHLYCWRDGEFRGA